MITLETISVQHELFSQNTVHLPEISLSSEICALFIVTQFLRRENDSIHLNFPRGMLTISIGTSSSSDQTAWPAIHIRLILCVQSAETHFDVTILFVSNGRVEMHRKATSFYFFLNGNKSVWSQSHMSHSKSSSSRICRTSEVPFFFCHFPPLTSLTHERNVAGERHLPIYLQPSQQRSQNSIRNTESIHSDCWVEAT